MRRRLTITVALVVLLVAAGALAVFLGAFETSVVGHEVETPLSAEAMKALAPQGRYVAAAADCAACHTAPGGAAWAGGRAFAMPFGTLYATNISPDPATGIGRWSRADFHRALRDGIAPGGRHLYPAMPYVSYREITAADADALYAFFMAEPPVAEKNREDSFPFPYVRRFMTFWNLLNLPAGGFPEKNGETAEATRGRYLVDALGHCGECHTPRDLTMAMIPSRYLQGARIEGVDAPDITPAGVARLGFTADGLARYMRAGLGPQGAMTFAMYDVVEHSTRYLTDADAAAMAAYLAGAALPAAGAVAAPAASPTGEPPAPPEGRRLYVALCAGCHGIDGEGTPHVAPAMTTNATLKLESPHNLLVVTLHGLPGGAFPDGEHMQPMPGFAGLVDDRVIAALANYLRTTWGGRGADATAAAAAEVRAAGG